MAQQIETKRIVIPGIVAGIILLVLGSYAGCVAGKATAERQKDDEFAKVLEAERVDHEQVEVVSNKQVKDLQEAVADKQMKLDVLADLVLKLKEAPAKVKYVTTVQTKLVPTEPATVRLMLNNLPKEKLFSLKVPDGELVVERMSLEDADKNGEDDTVMFQTYEQDFQLDAVLGEKSSSFLLRATSSFDGKEHEIPVRATVQYLNKDAQAKKVLKPGLSMRIGGFCGENIVTQKVAIGYGAGIGMPWLHPTPELDLLTPQIGFGQVYSPTIDLGAILGTPSTTTGATTSSPSFRGGIEIGSYNLGAGDKSFLDDTWLGAGISIGTDGSLAGDISLSTRL